MFEDIKHIEHKYDTLNIMESMVGKILIVI